jgi:hypothetical protein
MSSASVPRSFVRSIDSSARASWKERDRGSPNVGRRLYYDQAPIGSRRRRFQIGPSEGNPFGLLEPVLALLLHVFRLQGYRCGSPEGRATRTPTRARLFGMRSAHAMPRKSLSQEADGV